jgi:hypothetical protein
MPVNDLPRDEDEHFHLVPVAFDEAVTTIEALGFSIESLEDTLGPAGTAITDHDGLVMLDWRDRLMELHDHLAAQIGQSYWTPKWYVVPPKEER